MDNNYKLRSYKSVAQQMNQRIFTDYFYRLMLIAKARFRWYNLPNGIDEKWIERYLFTEGSALFFKDPELGFMVTRMVPAGRLNYYDEPTKVEPYAVNYQYTGPELYNNENCVIIRNNDDMIPTLPTVELYAYKLANIERTIDTNISAQKMPYIVTCSDKQRLSLKQIMRQKEDNEIVIYGDKNLDVSQIKVLDITPPIVFDRLQIQKNSVWNECMTFLGINNANMDKRERLVADEVAANDDQIGANEDVALKAREHACRLINEMWGTNIYVERRSLETASMDASKDFREEDEEVTVE